MAADNLIVLPINNKREFIKNSIPILEQLHLESDENNYDILVIDDGSTDDIYQLIEEYTWIKYIKHDAELGFGASFLSAYKYARDFEYKVMIFLDSLNTSILRDIEDLMDNIKYGYDIVSRSRILENYNHSAFNEQHINITTEISNALNEIINESISDPLTETIALNVNALENLELTEFTHGILLQIWIQSSFYGLSIMEIPCFEAAHFGQELEYDEDPVGYYLTIIETEKYLYKKGTIN